jgi:hypothetical protein
MAAKPTLDQAAILALKALAYLTNFDPELQRFLELSGAEAETLPRRANEPEFLVSVLDFLLSNEALLVGFCDETFVDARIVHLARIVLEGA